MIARVLMTIKRRRGTTILLALVLALAGCGTGNQPVIYNISGTTLVELSPGAPIILTPPATAAVQPTAVVIVQPPAQTAPAQASTGGEAVASAPLPGTAVAADNLPFQPTGAPPLQLIGTAPSLNFGVQTAVPTLAWRPPPMQVPVSIRPEDHFWFERPIGSDAVSWPHPYYRYGSTYSGFLSVHAGIDLDADRGTAVLAAGPGVVVWTGYGLYGTKPPENDPYGLAVAIKHDFGYQGQDLYTIYAHMSQIDVWPDQHVEAGQLLGLSGNTGNSSGPHLHFEVRVGDNRYQFTRNPELWLAPPTGWGVIAGRLLDYRGNYIDEYEMEVRNEFGQYFLVWTYGTVTANRDEMYKENFVLSDLPAGHYFISTWIGDEQVKAEVDVFGGQTSFVVMQAGFKDGVFHETSPLATHGPAPTLQGGATRTPIPTATQVSTPTLVPEQ